MASIRSKRLAAWSNRLVECASIASSSLNIWRSMFDTMCCSIDHSAWPMLFAFMNKGAWHTYITVSTTLLLTLVVFFCVVVEREISSWLALASPVVSLRLVYLSRYPPYVLRSALSDDNLSKSIHTWQSRLQSVTEHIRFQRGMKQSPPCRGG